MVAGVRPVKKTIKLRDLPAFFASLPHLSDEHAEAFARDVEEGRKWMNSLPVRDPWEERE